jgi:hypothetical protein
MGIESIQGTRKNLSGTDKICTAEEAFLKPREIEEQHSEAI